MCQSATIHLENTLLYASEQLLKRYDKVGKDTHCSVTSTSLCRNDTFEHKSKKRFVVLLHYLSGFIPNLEALKFTYPDGQTTWQQSFTQGRCFTDIRIHQQNKMNEWLTETGVWRPGCESYQSNPLTHGLEEGQLCDLHCAFKRYLNVYIMLTVSVSRQYQSAVCMPRPGSYFRSTFFSSFSIFEWFRNGLLHFTSKYFVTARFYFWHFISINDHGIICIKGQCWELEGQSQDTKCENNRWAIKATDWTNHMYQVNHKTFL